MRTFLACALTFTFALAFALALAFGVGVRQRRDQIIVVRSGDIVSQPETEPMGLRTKSLRGNIPVHGQGTSWGTELRAEHDAESLRFIDLFRSRRHGRLPVQHPADSKEARGIVLNLPKLGLGPWHTRWGSSSFD